VSEKRKPTYQEIIKLCNKKDKEIERLKEEINNLKFIPKTDFKEVIDLRDENKRLNNIIKEIEEHIKNRMRLQPDTIDLYILDKMTLIKLEELKGEKNE